MRARILGHPQLGLPQAEYPSPPQLQETPINAGNLRGQHLLRAAVCAGLNGRKCLFRIILNKSMPREPGAKLPPRTPLNGQILPGIPRKGLAQMQHVWGAIGTGLIISVKMRMLHRAETNLRRQFTDGSSKHPTPFAKSTSGTDRGRGSGGRDPHHNDFINFQP